MSPFIKLAILCAITFLAMAPGSFFHKTRLSFVLSVIWLAAALPAMLLWGLEARLVLLFYVVSGGIGLALETGGRK